MHEATQRGKGGASVSSPAVQLSRTDRALLVPFGDHARGATLSARTCARTLVAVVAAAAAAGVDAVMDLTPSLVVQPRLDFRLCCRRQVDSCFYCLHRCVARLRFMST